MASVVAYTGLAPQIIEVQENDGATALDWSIGDLVKCDGDGELVIATQGIILGIALKAATGVDNTKIPVQLINPNEIYVMKYSTSTAENIIGEMVSVTFTKSAHTCTTGGSAGTDAFYIVGLHPDDALGTDGGRVLVRFAFTALEGV